jgi:hypothetical protein
MARMRTTWSILLTLAGWLVFPAVADAQIVKCRDAQGRLTYTAERCPTGTQPEVLPQDLSPELHDPGRQPAPRPSGTIPPMSAELRAREQNFRHCQFFNYQSEPQCSDFVALEKHCSDRKHWDEPQCLLLVEFYSVRDAEQEARVRLIVQQRCKHMDRDACAELECNYDPMREPDTSKILQCARIRKLAVGRTWAQFDNKHNQAGQWHGRYVCLRSFHLREGAGQWSAARGFFSVERAFVDGREADQYVVSGRLGDRFFESMADAGEAFCEEHARRFEALAMRPENRGVTQPPPPPVPTGAIAATPGSSGRGRLPPPPDTPEFKARVAHFIERFPDCNGQGKPGCESWDKLQLHCHIRRHRSEVDCQALRLALPIASSRQMEAYSQLSGEPCRRGDANACRRHYCSITNRYQRSDTLLRQCSGASGLPSSDLWWQVGSQLETATVSSIFVCRQAFTLEGNVGQLRTDRAVIFVESPRQANQPVAPFRTKSLGASFNALEFKSAAEAADAGCRREAERLALLEANLPDQG